MVNPGSSLRFNIHWSAPPVSALARSEGPGARQAEGLQPRSRRELDGQGVGSIGSENSDRGGIQSNSEPTSTPSPLLKINTNYVGFSGLSNL